MSAHFTSKKSTLRLVLGLTLFVGCSEQTDFFPDEPGGGGSGGETNGGASAASGAGGTLGAQAGVGAESGATHSAGGTQSGGAGSPGSGGGALSGGTGGTHTPGGNAGVAGDVTEGGGESGTGGEGASGGNAAGGNAGEGAAGEAGTSGGTNGGSGGSGASGGSGGEAGASCTASTERCNGRDDDCNDDIDDGNACPAGCTAKTREGKLYIFCLEADANALPTYEAARSRCEAAGSSLELGVKLELARIESAGENDFLKQWIMARTSATGAVWFGANDLEEENIWVFGDDPRAERFFTARSEGGGMPYMDRFNDWASGRPNATNGEDEDCGAFDSEFAWQWNDVRCQVERLGFICEEEP